MEQLTDGDVSPVSKTEIDSIVEQIVENFKPQRVILFGSYAYGQPQRASDVDLLVIMPTQLKESEQAFRICKEIDYHFGLDLIVRTPETVSRRLALGDPFLREITNQGKVLYARTDG